MTRLITLIFSTSFSVWITSTAHASEQDAFVAARKAYAADDEKALARYAAQIPSSYVLAPYLDYWRLQLKLNTAEPAEVKSFLTKYADLPFVKSLRNEWLKQLGKNQQWQTFFEFYVAPEKKEDTSVACYAAQGRHRMGQSMALVNARPLWFSGRSQPDACDALFDLMKSNGVIRDNDVWQRMRLAFQANRVSLARSIARHLSQPISANRLRYIGRVYENPKRYLDKKKLNLNTRLGRELALYAVERVARSRPVLAIDLWKKNRHGFNRDDQRYAWGRIGLHLARNHEPRALESYDKSTGVRLDNEQLAWQARAALRAGDWDALLKAVAAMPQQQQEVSAWRYWKARALKQKKNIVAANTILVPLAKEYSFYGLLAAEELGDAVSEIPFSHVPDKRSVSITAALPGIQRALELYRLNMNEYAKPEWLLATRHFDDAQLIAAAELAFRERWYDIAINTANKTISHHNFALRYPTPYREQMSMYVRDNQLDEAWVYGLIRQESRFISEARSHAGASGLMQLMPATARWIAKKIRMNHYHPGLINRVNTNIEFGTFYLRHVLDRMDGQALMATAAYNAGPGRPKRWMADKSMDGAIYAETIPFTETRGYVKKVMANAHFYARRLGSKLQTLKQRIGVITNPDVAGENSR